MAWHGMSDDGRGVPRIGLCRLRAKKTPLPAFFPGGCLLCVELCVAVRWAGLAPECRQLTTSICLVNQPPFPTSGSEQHKHSFPCNVNTMPGPSASGSISSAVHFPPHAALCDPLSSRYTVAFDCLRMALPLMTLHCPTRRARHLQSQPIMPAHIPCPISFATSNPVYIHPDL